MHVHRGSDGIWFAGHLGGLGAVPGLRCSELIRRLPSGRPLSLGQATTRNRRIASSILTSLKNPGSDYGPKGKPIEVDAHDFEDKELGKVVPYGVYDVGANIGYVSLGIGHDTAQFAVNAARLWLDRMGRERYPATRKVMVTADCGGSNGPRLRLWKVELQRLADETGLTFQVCHYPPGTSKWNKIEHRMFCHITQNWRATPLTSRLAVVELIANTTTKTGLTIRCELDTNTYPKGIKVSEEQMAALNLKGDEFHPDWNYAISPRGQIVEP